MDNTLQERGPGRHRDNPGRQWNATPFTIIHLAGHVFRAARMASAMLVVTIYCSTNSCKGDTSMRLRHVHLQLAALLTCMPYFRGFAGVAPSLQPPRVRVGRVWCEASRNDAVGA
eukprot:363446-Chlamydomonas_euryale.AAC.5